MKGEGWFNLKDTSIALTSFFFFFIKMCTRGKAGVKYLAYLSIHTLYIDP